MIQVSKGAKHDFIKNHRKQFSIFLEKKILEEKLLEELHTCLCDFLEKWAFLRKIIILVESFSNQWKSPVYSFVEN